MWEIREVLRRVQRGEAEAAIKRATGRTRKRIRRYVEKAREVGWERVAEPDEGLAVAVDSSLHRFAVTQLGFHDRRRTTVRVAEVDFGPGHPRGK